MGHWMTPTAKRELREEIGITSFKQLSLLASYEGMYDTNPFDVPGM